MIIDYVLERVAPYVSDIDFLTGWISARRGEKTSEIITDIEKTLEHETDLVKITDFRILKNTLEKI